MTDIYVKKIASERVLIVFSPDITEFAGTMHQLSWHEALMLRNSLDETLMGFDDK